MEDIQMLIKMLECTATEKAALKKRCEIQRNTINRLLDENKELLLKVREYENDEFERACRLVAEDSYHIYMNQEVEESVLSRFLQNKNLTAVSKINMLEDYFNYSIPLMEILLTIE